MYLHQKIPTKSAFPLQIVYQQMNLEVKNTQKIQKHNPHDFLINFIRRFIVYKKIHNGDKYKNRLANEQ